MSGDLDAINVEVIVQAAEQGDALANDVFDRSFRAFGLAIVSYLHIFNPTIVVIGGGVSNLGERLFKPVRDTVERYPMSPRLRLPDRSGAAQRRCGPVGRAGAGPRSTAAAQPLAAQKKTSRQVNCAGSFVYLNYRCATGPAAGSE